MRARTTVLFYCQVTESVTNKRENEDLENYDLTGKRQFIE